MKQPSTGDRQRFHFRHAIMGLSLSLALASCGLFAAAPKPETKPQPTLNPWNNEVLYFALTDRFANGDPTNDNGGTAKPEDKANTKVPTTWHGGDFKGITQKIKEGYFQQLGVTAIWISPVSLQVPAVTIGDGPNKGAFHAGYAGYWAQDFLKVDPHFGTLADLKELVKTAHDNGLKIVQDMVVNHAGYDAQLVKDHPDWFHTQADCDASSNKDVDCALVGLPDFKQEKAEVTKFLNDAVRYWINELGIDGIRMDTMKHVPDAYWTQFFASGGAGDPKKVWTVGEVLVRDVNANKKYINDLGSPAVFDFPLQFAIRENLNTAGGNLNTIASVFDQDALYNDPSKLVTLVDNHDVKRFMSESVDGGVSLPEATERLDLALSLIFTSRGTPSVYYGTEIAMIGKGDPYGNVLGETNREDMDFSKLKDSTLDERLKALANARKASKALTYGTQQVLSRPSSNGGQPLLVYRRTLEGSDPVVVLINNSNTDLNLSTLSGGKVQLFGTFAQGTALTELTGKTHGITLDANGDLTGTVAKRSAIVLTGKAGDASGTDATLPVPGNLTTLSGNSAVKVSWNPVAGDQVTGYRVYVSSGGAYQLYNIAPVPANQTGLLIQGLKNDTTYTFKVVSVGKTGKESKAAATITAKPNPAATAKVTFTVDARALGEADVEVRRFDDGSTEYQMTEVAGKPGFWTVTQNLPLFKTILFKFGDDTPTAKNSGYEGDGQGDRTLTLDSTTVNYEGVYNFTELPAPDSFISGKVTSEGSGVKGVLLEADLDKRNYYAFSRSDGSFYLPLPKGKSVQVTASKDGFNSKTVPANSGDTLNITLEKKATATYKYTLDGNLTDWTAPKGTATNAAGGYDTAWGADNIFNELRLDSDSKNLYLAYRYRASKDNTSTNSAVIYVDVKAGGFTDASKLSEGEKKHQASFDRGIDFFVHQKNGSAAEVYLWDGSKANAITSFDKGTSGTSPAFTTEIAIPWASLGLGAAPASVNAYAGVFGDNWGAGDILPNTKSTPGVSGNTISGDNRFVTFTAPFTITP